MILFFSVLQPLIIRPKQRHQFGSKWCTGDEINNTKNDLLCGFINVWLQHQHCNVQRRYKAHCWLWFLHYPHHWLWIWTQALDINDSNWLLWLQEWYRPLALWMDGWEASPRLLAQNTIFFFIKCETKLFCFKSSILIHILFCTVHYMSVYGCKCFLYVCVYSFTMLSWCLLDALC